MIPLGVLAGRRSGATFADVVIATVPSHYNRMGDTSGTTAVDEMGNYDGVYAGTVALGGGSIVPSDSGGSSFAIDAAGEYASIASIGTVYDATIMLAYQGSGGGTPIMFRDNSKTTGTGTLLYPTGTECIIRIGGSGNYYTGIPNSTILDNTPHLFMLTRSSSNDWALYMDSATAAWSINSARAGLLLTTLYVGRNGYNSLDQVMYGNYAEVGVWDRVLTSTEIGSIYSAWAA